MFSEPHSTKQIEDCVAWAARGRRRRRSSTPPPAGSAATARSASRSSRCAGRSAARSRSLHGTRGPDPAVGDRRAAGRADRRLAGPARGRRARPARPGPGAGQPADRRVRRRGWRPRRRGARRGRAPRAAGPAALYLSSPIGLGHARRDVAIAGSCGSAPRTWRSTGWPSTRSPACWPTPGRRVHPASAWLANETGAHRGRVRRARPARVPGDPPDGRDPGRTTSWCSPTSSPSERLRPGRRRRGLGRRLLPAREPGAQAVRLRLADRLRRLAADARGRRPRGRADRRLQRRDDRAAGPVPAGARPVGLRRQPRGRRGRRLRPRPAADPRLDGGELRLRRLRHRLRPRAAARHGGAAPGAGRRRPASGCAW